MKIRTLVLAAAVCILMLGGSPAVRYFFCFHEPQARVPTLTFQDLLGGLVALEGSDVRLRPQQARDLLPSAQTLAAGEAEIGVLQTQMNQELRSDQAQWLLAHRWDELARLDDLFPPDYRNLSDPLRTIGYARDLLREAPGPSGNASHNTGREELTWFHISQSVIYFHHRRPTLEYTSAQALMLMPLEFRLQATVETTLKAAKRVQDSLTAEQRGFILRQKQRQSGIAGTPGLDGALDLLRRRSREP